MSTKFTKGEWSQSHRKTTNKMYSTEVYDEKGKTICVLAWHSADEGDGVKSTDREANAHLIAAAPAMYELLKKFLPLDEDGNGSFQYNEGSEHFGDEVEAVLKKARGE